MNLRQTLKIPARRLPTFFLAGFGLLLSVNILAAAAEDNEIKIVPPKMLADFEDQQAVKIRADECEAKRTTDDGGHALEIVTQAAASWPGVLIEPRQGKWDLSPFDAVEIDVSNPQDAAVRVLLSVNNPGAEGQKNNNTESVTVPPQSKAVLVVPFGMWHGTSGHNLDLKNIVSLKVLLDKPGRSHRFLVDNIRAVCFDRGEMQKIFADPFFKQLKPIFGRGINLGNALEAPKEGEWGVVLKELYFEKIAAAGFDSVRIPVRWSTHADESPPYKIDTKFFDRVDWAVDQSLKRHLIPVVNMHHYEEIFNDPDKHSERFLAMWRQIAEHYKDYPPELAFELLNEPNKNLTAEKWNRISSEAIRIIRPSNPTRQIVVGPVGWNGIGDLPTLELPEDDLRLVATVHYYSPFQFTHQGAEWAGPEARAWLGNKWTGTKKEQMAVMLDLDKAITWAVEHRRPMWLGEFGAYNKADLDSRARWTAFVADEALKRKMGFAYWEFCSGFGLFDPQKNQWIEPLKQALLDAGNENNYGDESSVKMAETADKTNVDPKALVEAIVSPNPAPVILGGIHPNYGPPLFDKKYNWTEYDRIRKAIETLAHYAEEAWPELIKHLDDKRYSTTANNDIGGYNYTVGEVCKWIIMRSLTDECVDLISDWDLSSTKKERVYPKLSYPDMFLDTEKLKEWCEKRKEKKLYELQIEICEWAITEIANFNILTDEERKPFIDMVRAKIAELRKSKKAVRLYKFGHEGFFEDYSPKKAERIRQSEEKREKENEAGSTGS